MNTQVAGRLPTNEALIGSNNPPEKIEMLLAAEDLEKVIAAGAAKRLEEANALLDVCSRVPAAIADADVYQRATTLVANIRSFLAALDDERSGHKAPYLKAGKLIDETYRLIPAETSSARETKKGYKSDLDVMITEISKKLSAYDTAKYLEEQKQAEEERKRLADLAAKDGIQIDASLDANASLGAMKSVHGGSAVRQIEKTWVIENEDQIPRNLLMPDPAKIKALIDSGAVEIPGIRIEEKVKTHVKRT